MPIHPGFIQGYKNKYPYYSVRYWRNLGASQSDKSSLA
jgi:hypothetical protein